MNQRILIFDVETSPMLAHVWSKWVDGSVIDIQEDWYMLAVAWKWLGEKETHVLSVTPDEPDNDEHLIRQLHELFDEADIVVGHNGDRFDVRKSQARMLLLGMEPPSPFKTIDTLKVLKKSFMLTSNKLDDACQALGLRGKVEHTGFQLWLDCMAGDPDALELMREYNRVDVEILEELYLKLRPWISSHPHVHNTAEGECPVCGSDNIHGHGTVSTKTAIYQRHRCQECGSVFRGRQKDRTIDSIYTTMVRK
jgi:hypothetical protein